VPDEVSILVAGAPSVSVRFGPPHPLRRRGLQGAYVISMPFVVLNVALVQYGGASRNHT
jgi:hypothetical protein